jgi:hypothetical protein
MDQNCRRLATKFVKYGKMTISNYNVGIKFPDTNVDVTFLFTYDDSIGSSANTPSMSGDGNNTYDTGAITGEILSPTPSPLVVELLSFSTPSTGYLYLRFTTPQWFLDVVNNQLYVDKAYAECYERYKDPPNTVFTLIFTNFIQTPLLTIRGECMRQL